MLPQLPTGSQQGRHAGGFDCGSNLLGSVKPPARPTRCMRPSPSASLARGPYCASATRENSSSTAGACRQTTDKNATSVRPDTSHARAAHPRENYIQHVPTKPSRSYGEYLHDRLRRVRLLSCQQNLAKALCRGSLRQEAKCSSRGSRFPSSRADNGNPP